MVPVLVRDNEDVQLLLRFLPDILRDLGHDGPRFASAEDDSAIDHEMHVWAALPRKAQQEAIAKAMAIHPNADTVAAFFRGRLLRFASSWGHKRTD